VVIPAVRIMSCIFSIIGDIAWSEFEEKAGGRTATWATVQPENDWGIRRCIARFKEPVLKIS
jgi:hypothetical protein